MECQASSNAGKNSNSNYEAKHNRIGAGGLWNNSIEGALGEFAVAKYLNLYPTGVTAWNTTDVGEHYEIRTRPKDYQELFIKKHDKQDKYYILVQGAFGDYRLRGWISAYEAFEHRDWFHNNNSKTSFNYWVPHESLHSISTLPKEAPCQKISSLSL